MLIRAVFALSTACSRPRRRPPTAISPAVYTTHTWRRLLPSTVIRMNQLIEAAEPPAMEKASRDAYMHKLARYTATKEHHAELIKHEVRIIRGDFFKPDNSPDKPRPTRRWHHEDGLQGPPEHRHGRRERTP